MRETQNLASLSSPSQARPPPTSCLATSLVLAWVQSSWPGAAWQSDHEVQLDQAQCWGQGPGSHGNTYSYNEQYWQISGGGGVAIPGGLLSDTRDFQCLG